VTALAKTVGVSGPALSQHLKRLRLAGAVTGRREGHNVFYSLTPGPVRDLLLNHVQP
jgi:DNA-binding transcriptional ArsR family regulator